VPLDIKVTRYKPAASERAELAVHLAFDAHDPIGASVYRGLDALVSEIMSKESAQALVKIYLTDNRCYAEKSERPDESGLQCFGQRTGCCKHSEISGDGFLY
jgi:hypothetical protein